MKKARINISKILLVTVILFSAIFPNYSVRAAGPTQPTGPQNQTGTTETSGVTGVTGVSETTGPTQPTGVTQATSVSTTDQTSGVNDVDEPQVVSPAYADSYQQYFPDAPVVAAPTTTNDPPPSNGSGSESSASIKNQSNIDNNVDYQLNSGNNNISNNTVAGNVTTGDINGAINILNLGNSVLGEGSTFSAQNVLAGDGDIVLDGNANNLDISGINIETGPGSNNSNQLNNNNVVAVFESNSSDVGNTIQIDADSGSNTVSNNSYLGNITTGDINLGVNLFNIINVFRPDLALAIDVWNILGDVNGDISLANQTTGSATNNINDATYAKNVLVDIDQNSDIDNGFDLSLNTGDNSIGANTVSGAISTGKIDARNSVTNIANVGSPMYILLNVFGDWDGDYGGLDPNYVIVNVVNQQTGADSNNINTAQSQNSADISITNDSNISNQIAVNANTGRNSISNNTVLGKLTTGSIKLSDNVINISNSFDSGVAKFALKIINIFGNWKHKHGDGKGGGGDGGGGGTVPIDVISPITTIVPKQVVSTISSIPSKGLGLHTLPAAGADLEAKPGKTQIANNGNVGGPATSRSSTLLLAALMSLLISTLYLKYKTSLL